jgi:hypothetical protein
MALGAGKYDAECELVRERTEASGAMVIVFSGKAGNGFSCQLPGFLVPSIPGVLRQMADQIEKDANTIIASL